MSDDRQRVLEATEIVDVVGDHLALKPKGREYVGLCPFHDDHKPSMSVVPHKQIYCCFACGAAGNVYDFVMRYHNMDFREALKYLADRANIELTPYRPTGAAPEGDEGSAVGVSRADLARANQAALGFFRKIFNREDLGGEARKAAQVRGISEEMIERFEIGAAPDMWDGLMQTIANRSMELRPFVEAGLVRERDGGKRYDTFRHRLMFPIFDQLGRPIAFGGRKLREGDDPKYMNSPESSIYDKSASLFGIKQASETIRTTRTAVVTEGYTDVIACHQAGFTNVVATLGTSLTRKHASMLMRLCDSVVLLFDGDEAGARAADKALEVFFAAPIEVRITTLPGGEDPDDLLKREGGPEALREAIDTATDALEYRFTRLSERLDNEGKPVGSAARASAINDEIARLNELGLDRIDPIRAAIIFKRIARVSGVEESAIREVSAAQRLRPSRQPVSESAPSSAPMNQRRRWTPAEFAFGCLLVEPKIVGEFPEESRDITDGRAYGSSQLREAVDSFARIHQAEGRAPGVDRLVAEVDSSETKSALASLVAQIERLTGGDAEAIAANWNDAYKRARIEWAEIAALARGRDENNRGGDLESIRASIEARRATHQQFGGNPRAMPRPAT